MSIGKARTSKFQIGTAELRVGPLTEAMRLKTIHSVGLVDNVSMEYAMNSVDLMQGFPQKPVDTAVASEEGTITGSLREYSRRNLGLLFGAGVLASATDVATTLDVEAAANATALSVASEAGFAADDLVVIYHPVDKGMVTVGKLSATAAGSLTLIAATPTLHVFPVGSVVFKAGAVAIGGIDTTKYFAVQMVQIQRGTGRPVIGEFWKASVNQGGSIGNNAEDFASTDLSIRLVEPLISDWDTGGDLEHLASIIPTHPMGLVAAGND